MKELLLKLIAILLHHANRASNIFGDKKAFYTEKERLLKKHGTFLGYEIQHIAGKKCFSCDGSGDEWDYYQEILGSCSSCIDGWYKQPFTSVLEKYQLMGFYFHIPKERIYSYNKGSLKLYNVVGEIDGYITHKEPNTLLVKLFYIVFLPNVFFRYIGKK